MASEGSLVRRDGGGRGPVVWGACGCVASSFCARACSCTVPHSRSPALPPPLPPCPRCPQVYLTGGYTYDPEAAQWVATSDVFYLDLQLGWGAVWTQLEGNAQVLARNPVPTALTEGIGVSAPRDQLVAPNNKVGVGEGRKGGKRGSGGKGEGCRP